MKYQQKILHFSTDEPNIYNNAYLKQKETSLEDSENRNVYNRIPYGGEHFFDDIKNFMTSGGSKTPFKSGTNVIKTATRPITSTAGRARPVIKSNQPAPKCPSASTVCKSQNNQITNLNKEVNTKLTKITNLNKRVNNLNNDVKTKNLEITNLNNDITTVTNKKK